MCKTLLLNLILLLAFFNLAEVYSWTSANTYGVKCRSDTQCVVAEADLTCSTNEPRTCRCRRKLEWDHISKRCYLMEEEAFPTKFDPVKDLIIPGIIVMTIGAMVYLGIKLFCNCGKMWRRRRRRMDMPRELEENLQLQQQQHLQPQQQPTWVASYRVFSSLNGMDPRSAGALTSANGPSFSMHTTPCMGLFLPSSHLAATASPPPYEEALKHKVIMSSYPGVVPAAPNPPPHEPPPD